jgi:hypothetical protein
MEDLSLEYWSARVQLCPDFPEMRKQFPGNIPLLDLNKLEGVCLDITLSPP